MKNKKILVILMIIAVVFSLVACSSDKSSGSEFVGEWQSVAIEEDGKKYESEYMNNFIKGMMQLEVKKDSTLIVKDMDFSAEGTWSEKDGVATFTVDGDSINGKIINKQLVLDESGFKIFFDKKK